MLYSLDNIAFNLSSSYTTGPHIFQGNARIDMVKHLNIQDERQVMVLGKVLEER